MRDHASIRAHSGRSLFRACVDAARPVAALAVSAAPVDAREAGAVQKSQRLRGELDRWVASLPQ